MKFKFLLLTSLSVVLWLSGCGSDQPMSNANVNASSSANAPTNILANVPIVDFNANAGPSDGNQTTANVAYPGVPVGNIKPSVLPAPEDSEFTMQLTDVGVETRTFKNHPQLLKVVKTITPKEQTVKVYLRDGRVIPIPAEKVRSMRIDAAASFLNAAGIKLETGISAEEEKKLKDAKNAAKKAAGEQ